MVQMCEYNQQRHKSILSICKVTDNIHACTYTYTLLAALSPIGIATNPCQEALGARPARQPLQLHAWRLEGRCERQTRPARLIFSKSDCHPTECEHLTACVAAVKGDFTVMMVLLAGGSGFIEDGKAGHNYYKGHGANM